MDTREQILTMGRNLPRGAKKEVAKLTGLTEQTIVKFFKTGGYKEEKPAFRTIGERKKDTLRVPMKRNYRCKYTKKIYYGL